MAAPQPPLPAPGAEVKTACGGTITFTADSPRALYREQWVFFCSLDCVEDFVRDPVTSCYADQIAQQ